MPRKPILVPIRRTLVRNKPVEIPVRGDVFIVEAAGAPFFARFDGQQRVQVQQGFKIRFPFRHIELEHVATSDFYGANLAVSIYAAEGDIDIEITAPEPTLLVDRGTVLVDEGPPAVLLSDEQASKLGVYLFNQDMPTNRYLSISPDSGLESKDGVPVLSQFNDTVGSVAVGRQAYIPTGPGAIYGVMSGVTSDDEINVVELHRANEYINLQHP